MPTQTIDARAASYDVGAGRARDAEFARLDAQAELTFGREFAMMSAAGLACNGRILDLGSGNGAVTTRLRQALPDAEVVAADVDAHLLATVLEPSLHIDGGRIPAPDEAFTDVVVRFVAQHVPAGERPGLWAEVLRVLVPGGRVHVIDVDDADAGLTRPLMSDVAPVIRRVAEAQARRGGDRRVVTRVARELEDTGFAAVRRVRGEVTSDGRPLEDFAVHLGPARHAAEVAAGVLSVADLALLAAAWRRVLAAPDGHARVHVHLVHAVRRAGTTDLPTPLTPLSRGAS